MEAESLQEPKQLWRALKQWVKRWPLLGNGLAEQGKEKDASFYDEAFESVEGYHKHYTESEYYFLWAVIVDRIRRLEIASILEIGCGSGQLARAIRDSFPDVGYCGFDFSETAIGIARRHSPDLRFKIQNALTTDLPQSYDYGLVISTEFLEHVEEDLQILGKFKTGAWFIGTVPNFPYVSHVRHFSSEAAVRERYSALFDSLDVCSFLANAKGKTFYLMQGRLKGGVR